MVKQKTTTVAQTGLKTLTVEQRTTTAGLKIPMEELKTTTAGLMTPMKEQKTTIRARAELAVRQPTVEPGEPEVESRGDGETRRHLWFRTRSRGDPKMPVD